MTTEFPSKRPAYERRYAKLHRNGYRTQVSALGATRRIQALHAIGYTRAQLQEAFGLSRKFLFLLSAGRVIRIDRGRDQKIREVYRTLCVQPLHKGFGASQVRTWAKKNGWFPPMAWDDIDDPNEQPSRYAHGRDRTKETARRRELRRGSEERQQQEAA